MYYHDIWPDIYYDVNLTTPRALLVVCQYLVYNHLPIGIILILHHKNFRVKDKNEKRTIKRVSKSEF